MSLREFMVGCLIAYCLIGGLLYLGQRYIIFQPFRENITPAQWGAKDMQEVIITTEDGLKLKSWYKPASSHALTLLYLHGNAGHIGYRVPYIKAYLTAGYGVLLLSYRGYAQNPGKPSESGFKKDANAAIAFLQQQGVMENSIVVFGESIGTSLAVYLASRHPLAGMVLLSAFTSAADIGQFHYPIFPVKFLIRDKFDSTKLIRQTKLPTLFIHAKEDTIVPIQFGYALYKKVPHKNKISVVISDKDHNSMLPKDINPPVLAFLKKLRK